MQGEVCKVDVFKDGQYICDFTLRAPTEDVLEAHHNFYIFTKDNLNIALLVSEQIVEQAQHQGFSKIITYSAEADEKMVRYWRLMGFIPIGEVNVLGTNYACAVMEI